MCKNLLDTCKSISDNFRQMQRFSTNQAAKKLGIHTDTLAHYVAVGKVPTPEVIVVGKGKRVVHAWTEEEIEHVRQLLPRIANGRKTRYSKLREKQKAQTESPVPRKPERKNNLNHLANCNLPIANCFNVGQRPVLATPNAP